MRRFTLVMLLLVSVISPAFLTGRASAASTPSVTQGIPAAPRQQTATSTSAVPTNDDSRVGVQLVVLGIVAFVVIGIGSVAYLIRKRVGLIAPPPDQGSGQH